MANDTKYITLENLTRLANKIKADIQLKQDQLQFAELPDAAAYTGKVVQYVGDDTAELKAGAFYKSDGTTWVQVSVTETPQPVEQTLALVSSLPAWAEADASKVYAVKQVSEAYTDVYMPDDQSGFILVGSNDPSKTPDQMYMVVFNGGATEGDLATINATQAGVPHYMPSNDKVYVQVPEGTDVDEAIAGMNGAGTAKANRWVEVNIANAFKWVIHTPATLPSYVDALALYHSDIDNGANVSCFVVTEPAESSLAFYVKKADETGAWYTVQTSGAAQPVDLPTFTAISDADIEAAFEG